MNIKIILQKVNSFIFDALYQNQSAQIKIEGKSQKNTKMIKIKVKQISVIDSQIQQLFGGFITQFMSERSASPSSDGNFPFRKTKRIKKRKQEHSEKISQCCQSKITEFFRSHPGCHNKSPKPSEIEITQLQNQLNQLIQEEQQYTQKIETLKEEHLTRKIQFESFIKKSRQLLADSLCSVYERERRSMSRIDQSKGIFLKGQFIRGNYGKQFIRAIQEIKKELADIPKENVEQRNFLSERLEKLERKNQHINEQIDDYKEKLKLSIQESNSTFAGNWPLINKRYQILGLIGRGGFSEVYRAYDLQEKREVAIKLSCLSGFAAQNCHYMTREYQIHQTLNHPNIAKLYEYLQYGNDKICIVIQLCEGPELSKFLAEKKKLTEHEAKYITKQIVNALYYLSTLQTKVIHYDLKPQNIIFHKGMIKILDFGLCKQMDNEHSRIALTNQGVGTYWYLPPQAFIEKNPEISNKVDIWSTGVILFEMLYGRKPFGHNLSQANIFKQGVILNASQVNFPQQSSVSELCKQFIKGCLQYNPQNRLSPLQALNHPYFKS